MLEAELEAYFRGQCKRLGLLTIKLNLQQNRGYPDRLVLYKGKAHFSELKTLAGKQTPLQKYRASTLEAQGFSVPVLRTKDEIKTYLEAICLTT
jgi:hypothetical protein